MKYRKKLTSSYPRTIVFSLEYRVNGQSLHVSVRASEMSSRTMQAFIVKRARQRLKDAVGAKA